MKKFLFLLVLSMLLTASSFAAPRFNVHYNPKEKPKSVNLIDVEPLFDKVCTLYDIQALTFQGDIYILKDGKAVKAKYEELFNKKLLATDYLKSFSMVNPSEVNIYISWQDYSKGVLAHEISHAVINTYSPVPLTTRIQEILAKYAEYAISNESK